MHHMNVRSGNDARSTRPAEPERTKMNAQDKVNDLEILSYLRTHTVKQIVEDSRLVMAGELILDLCEEITRLECEKAGIKQ